MALSLHTWWYFNVWYILFQWWGLVPFRWLHKYAKLSYLEFREPSHFSNIIIVCLKNWHLVRHELQTCRTNFFWDKNYCRGIPRDYSAIYCTFPKGYALPHVAKQTMSFLAEFFGEQICNWPHVTRIWVLGTFFYGLISRILSVRMPFEVLQSSRKKLRTQVGKLIPLSIRKYLWTCWKRLLHIWRMREVILNTYCD